MHLIFLFLFERGKLLGIGENGRGITCASSVSYRHNFLVKKYFVIDPGPFFKNRYCANLRQMFSLTVY